MCVCDSHWASRLVSVHCSSKTPPTKSNATQMSKTTEVVTNLCTSIHVLTSTENAISVPMRKANLLSSSSSSPIFASLHSLNIGSSRSQTATSITLQQNRHIFHIQVFVVWWFGWCWVRILTQMIYERNKQIFHHSHTWCIPNDIAFGTHTVQLFIYIWSTSSKYRVK